MKYYNTIIRMTEMKRLAIPRTGEDLEELELSYTDTGDVECQLLWKL